MYIVLQPNKEYNILSPYSPIPISDGDTCSQVWPIEVDDWNTWVRFKIQFITISINLCIIKNELNRSLFYFEILI